MATADELRGMAHDLCAGASLPSPEIGNPLPFRVLVKTVGNETKELLRCGASFDEPRKNRVELVFSFLIQLLGHRAFLPDFRQSSTSFSTALSRAAWCAPLSITLEMLPSGKSTSR